MSVSFMNYTTVSPVLRFLPVMSECTGGKIGHFEWTFLDYRGLARDNSMRQFKLFWFPNEPGVCEKTFCFTVATYTLQKIGRHSTIIDR